MDDFERAVLIVFNETGAVDGQLKERAAAFVGEIKQSPEVWRLCTERFSTSAYVEVKFWCLQTLHEVIRNTYSSLAQPSKDTIKTALLTWVTRDCNNSQQPLPPFLRNKIAQTLVAVLQHEYPATWPGFFQDLLRAILPGSALAPAGSGGRPSGTLARVTPGNEGVVDMFCRILVSVDEDLVSLDIPRSQNESKLSMHVKDSMREHSIADIAAAWYLLAEAYSSKAPDLAAMVLGTMQRYISWIDIGLAANDKFVALLEAILDGAAGGGAGGAGLLSLRCAAAECLTEIVTKRMDAVPKLNLVQNMGIVPRCAAWAAGFPVLAAGGPAVGSAGTGMRSIGDSSGDDDVEELLLKLARLLSSLAGEIIDALKKVENGVISLTAAGLGVSSEAAQEAATAAAHATQLLDQLFPALLSAFRSEIDEIALPLLPFMSAYVARLKTLHKRNSGLSEADLMNVRAIFLGTAVCARYPRDSANNYPDQYLSQQQLLGSSASSNGPAGGGAGGPTSPPATSPTAQGSAGRQAAAAGLFPGIALPPLAMSAAKDEQTEVEEKRRDLFTLFKNLSKVVFNEALTFVGGLLQSVIAPRGPAAAAGPGGRSSMSVASWQEAEIAVTLLYEIGEAAPDDALKSDAGSLTPLVTALAHACAAAGAALATAGNSGVIANGGPAGQAGVLLAGMQAAQQQGQAMGIGPLPWSTHRLVALAALETFVRYCRVLQQSPPVLAAVVPMYLDGRGMGHPSEDVSTRACYLFCRLAKQLRSNMRPMLPSLLQSMQPHLAHVATSPVLEPTSGQVGTREGSSKASAPVNAVVDDRLYIFEAVGLLLGQEDVGAEEQVAALNALLTPLTAQVETSIARGGQGGQGLGPALVVQAMEAVVRLNKGFKTELATRQRPQIGRMFAHVLEVAVAVPRELPTHRFLRARFISFVHRMVEGLQAMLLPYLPTTLEVLLLSPTQPEVGELLEVLVLTNQLMLKFKEALAPLMEGVLPVVVSKVHTLLNASWDWSGRQALPGGGAGPMVAPSPAAVAGTAANGRGPQGANAAGQPTSITVTATLEEAREKAELQKLYYSLLHALAHSNLSGVLLRVDPAGVLEPLMGALTRGAATHVDAGMRRTCVQVYMRLIQEWCSSGSAEAIPGFKRYAMEHLGGEACILGLLRSQPPLDPRDGGTMALLQDLAAALKLVYEKCGDEFAAHLLQVAAPAAGLPSQLAQQLVFTIQRSEAKDVRDALRSLLMQSQGIAVVAK